MDAAGGSVTSSHSPAGTRSDLPAGRPPTSTAPAPISSAARVLDRPNILAIAASSRSPSRPSGTGTRRWTGAVTPRRRRAGQPAATLPTAGLAAADRSLRRCSRRGLPGTRRAAGQSGGGAWSAKSRKLSCQAPACYLRAVCWSAPFLSLLAAHAQGRPGERLQAGLADRLTARLAPAVGACVNSRQRPLGLDKQIARVVGQRELMLPLVGLRSHVGLVVAGIADGIA